MPTVDLERRPGAAVWIARRGDVEARFVGRAGTSDRVATLAAAAPGGPLPAVAWATQVHGARVLPATPGWAGEGDALVSRRPALALTVATADCVPVLLAGEGEAGAVHAGWRGIVAGVVGEAVRALATPAARVHAWIGPAIGACCYEVGDDVARDVARASSAAAVVRVAARPRPHLDLHAAVTAQLERAGVASITRLALCTRCTPELLWSYRRDGTGAGRNLAFVWRATAAAETLRS